MQDRYSVSFEPSIFGNIGQYYQSKPCVSQCGGKPGEPGVNKEFAGLGVDWLLSKTFCGERNFSDDSVFSHSDHMTCTQRLQPLDEPCAYLLLITPSNMHSSQSLTNLIAEKKFTVSRNVFIKYSHRDLRICSMVEHSGIRFHGVDMRPVLPQTHW